MAPDAGSSAASDYRCRGAIATLVGTSGDDRLRGTPHDDVIVGHAGNDVIYALGGDDKVCDNDGNDHVFLGPGDDQAGGGAGNDHIEGGSGRDWLAGGGGNDRVNGGAGNDRIIGGLGDDKLRGEGGNDNIAGGPGTDNCRGGPGRDRVRTCETGDTRSDRPPVAVDDADATSEVAPKVVPVLGNDSDPDHDPLRVASVDTAGTAGTVTVSGGGSAVRYDPNGRFATLAEGEHATDTFRYQLVGGTGFGTVTMTISGTDTAPTATADTRNVTEDDTAQTIDALGNDTDPDGGEPKSIQSVTQPANGAVTIMGGGSALTYEPDPDYCNSGALGSPDTFSYTLAPGGSRATISMTVDCVNDAPVLTSGGTLGYVGGSGATQIDPGLSALDIDSVDLTGATVAITSNFASAEDSLAFTDQAGIAGTYDSGTGVLTLTGNSSVATYEAALRSVAYDNSSDTPSTATRTVSFQVTDSSGAESAVATRDIDVTPGVALG